MAIGKSQALAILAFFGAATNASPIDLANGSDLVERQCGEWTPSSQVVGDGDPHQNYLHKQLSQVITCDQSAGCSVGQSDSMSYTINWSADAAVTEWLSAGFAVSESWTTGNSYTCEGNPGDTICIWQNIAHTAYTVENGQYNACTGFSASGDSTVMYSPNENNAGGGYYCVVGTCRSQGSEYWVYSGPSGGPPS